MLQRQSGQRDPGFPDRRFDVLSMPVTLGHRGPLMHPAFRAGYFGMQIITFGNIGQKMTENASPKLKKGRPRWTDFLYPPERLYNLLHSCGFYDRTLLFDEAGEALPDAVEFEFLDRFRATFVRYGRGFSDWEAAADALGRSWRHYKRYLQGEIPVPRKQVIHLATCAAVDPDWIETGRGKPMPGKDAPIAMNWYAERKSNERRTGPVNAPLIGGTQEAGLLEVRKLAWRASAGHGSLAIDWLGETVKFPSIILQSVPLSPEHAAIMSASGDSMSPTIMDAELLLLDTSEATRTDIVDGRVYAFLLGDEGFVKRLRRDQRGLVMSSDNPLFPDMRPLEDDVLTIIGRVRWVGHML